MTENHNTSRKLAEGFHWMDFEDQMDTALSDSEKYQLIVKWAGAARGKNPNAFDAVTEWVLDDTAWTSESIDMNKQLLMQTLLARMLEQNIRLREYLKHLEPSGVVNEAVFKALDRFEEELSGRSAAKDLKEAVSRMFSDFSTMLERSTRKWIAGNKTGAYGTDTAGVDIYGYINVLKDCDAAVQWALFMPDMVEQQQKGFRVQSFEYRQMPAIRFIGKESCEGDGLDTEEGLSALFRELDSLDGCQSGFDYDLLFQHHYGKGVDVEHWHGFWGRFMKADTPVPEGFVSFDFVPQWDQCSTVPGPPFVSQFSFAKFAGDPDALHESQGFDSDAMYDITRNIMLGQGVGIPYPDKYWTAEVFLNGYSQYSSAYLFSAELPDNQL